MTATSRPDLAASQCLAIGRRALHQLRTTLERESEPLATAAFTIAYSPLTL